MVFEALRVKRTVGLGWIALLLLAPGGFAQAGGDRSDIRIVSSFVAAGEPVPANCREQAHTFAESLVRYPRPASWHWVLVCDEAGWGRFLRLSGRDGQDSIYASTDLAARTTYLRGARLATPGDFGAELDRVVAHELAHIRLNSRDEPSAEALARLWSREREERQRASTGSENTGN